MYKIMNNGFEDATVIKGLYENEHIRIKKEYLEMIGGEKPKNKPVIILFNGFGTSKIYWEYNFVGKAKLEKNNFMRRLETIGDVFTFNSNFFNVNYYSIPKEQKERTMWRKIYEKYRPHGSNIDFTLGDLDYKNICNNVYNQVVNKYGKNRRYIVIGHSYGSGLALLFSKLYKKYCDLCVCIDNPPYLLDFFQKYDARENRNIVDKYFSNNNDLNKVLETIRTSTKNKVNVNDQIDLIYKLIEYRSCQDRIKYYDDILHVPTLFFRAFSSHPDNKFKKNWNKYSIKEKENLEKNNDTSMFKYYIMLDAEHFVWKKQEFSDMIVDEIKCMLK